MPHPGFRPLHFEAAINAGKHVFMEKPVAVDPAGVRKVIDANELAKKKNLAVAVGLQRHHEPIYIETIKRLQDGHRSHRRHPRLLERRRRLGPPPQGRPVRNGIPDGNWYYFNWLCGDHITEQHIHNLDVINWLMGGYRRKRRDREDARSAPVANTAKSTIITSSNSPTKKTATAPFCSASAVTSPTAGTASPNTPTVPPAGPISVTARSSTPKATSSGNTPRRRWQTQKPPRWLAAGTPRPLRLHPPR
ncbi:MAG UNVERIFIED_CONTAM: Gfo/Idh/MocA family oxidoreductase [Planctomycetaceae bacterium]